MSESGCYLVIAHAARSLEKIEVLCYPSLAFSFQSLHLSAKKSNCSSQSNRCQCVSAALPRVNTAGRYTPPSGEFRDRNVSLLEAFRFLNATWGHKPSPLH